jgi:hypothetical protein
MQQQDIYAIWSLTMDVSNATARTSCVAICLGMNTKSSVSSKPFRIAGRFFIISFAALLG